MKQKSKLREDSVKLLKRMPFILVVYFTVIVINQDLMIFPGVVRSLLSKAPVPSQVVEHLLKPTESWF